MQFQVVHQAHELYMKLIDHELRFAALGCPQLQRAAELSVDADHDERVPFVMNALDLVIERRRQLDALMGHEAGASDVNDVAVNADRHATIAEIAGHPGIWKLIQQVKVHVDRYRRLTLPQRGRIAQVISEHEVVLTAIEAHDAVRAGSAMSRHLERLLDNITATQSINPEFFDERG